MKLPRCAALLACALISSPVFAQGYLSLGIDAGWSKQEMQGLAGGTGAEPHFSLITQSRDYTIEAGLRSAVTLGGRDIDLGLALIHSGPQTVDAAASAHRWIARTGRIASTESLSAMIVLRSRLWEKGDFRLDGAAGLGLARTTVHLAEPGQSSERTETVPQTMVGLRISQRLAPRTEIFSELRYAASPAVRVRFGPNRVIGHEVSGWGVGAGVTFLLK